MGMDPGIEAVLTALRRDHGGLFIENQRQEMVIPKTEDS
jgi:hypothetical protein